MVVVAGYYDLVKEGNSMTDRGEDDQGTKPKTESQPHKNWRHQIVSDILGHKLSEEELQQALRICDEEFTTNEEFSASEFFARFTASTPSAKLGKQTRKLFLQKARLPNDAQEQTTSTSSEAKASASQRPSISTPHAQTEGGSECRDNPRKFTNLSGSCRHLEGDQERLTIVVENLSVTGARIRLQHGGELRRGEVIRVEFRLDDAFCASISLKSEVRWVLSGLVGIEFICPAGLPNILTNYIRS